MMGSGKVNPASMITHVGGLDSVVETTLNLPNIKGGKKLIYTHISMPLTAIADFEKLGETDPMFKSLPRSWPPTTDFGAMRPRNIFSQTPNPSTDLFLKLSLPPNFSTATRILYWRNYKMKIFSRQRKYRGRSKAASIWAPSPRNHQPLDHFERKQKV